VDRDHELAALGSSLDAVADRSGSVVIVQGAAGIGKSRLLAVAVSLAGERGMRALTARARQAERDFSFGLVLQLLDATVAALPPDQRQAVFSGSAGLARPLFEGQADLSLQSPHPFMHGLYWMMVNLAQHGPLLLSVDDLQWADDLSLQFLAYLAERIEGLPIVVLAATRPPQKFVDSHALIELLGVPDILTLRVAALTRAGVAEVVRAQLGQADDEFCRACAEITSGNPFYLQETLRSVGAEQLPPKVASSHRLRQLGAASVGRASLFRLMRLGPAPIALVQAFAVLGDRTPLRMAAKLAKLDLETAATAADQTIVEGLLRGENGVFDFIHPLIGELIAAEVSPTQQGLTHRRAAQLLREDNGLAEVAASHLLAAPAGGEQWAVDVLREAARRANQLGASEAAARFLRRALEEDPASADRGELLTELGEAETIAAVGEPVDHLREALRLQADPDRFSQISRLLARALVATGHRHEAAQILEAALSAAATADSTRQKGLVLDYLATCMFEPGLRQTALTRITPLLRPTTAPPSPESRATLAFLAMRAGQDARPAEAITLAEQAWSGGQLLAENGPDDPPWLLAMWACALGEDYERSAAICTAAIGAARRSGSVNAFVTASYFLGFSRYRQGQLTNAAADVDQASQPIGVQGNPYVVATTGLRAMILLELGDTDAAESALQAPSAFPKRQSFEIASNLHAHGRILAARGQHRTALEAFLSAGRLLAEGLSVSHTVVPWRFHGALAALQLGDAARARRLVEPMLTQATTAGLRISLASSLRVLGLVERGKPGIELLREAESLYATTQAALDHAYALADLGAALRRAGLRSEATQHLRLALDMAARMGAARLGKQVQDELTAAGARPRRQAIQGPNSLTPTERRVAELVADGLTNLQTAQSLFVTPKTIEYHLLHIYRKLDIRRRTELIAALERSRTVSDVTTAANAPKSGPKTDH